MSEIKEFVDETKEAAVERAVRHFGVPEEKLSVYFVSDKMEISGLGGSVMILASTGQPSSRPRREPREDRREGRREDRGDDARPRGRERGPRTRERASAPRREPPPRRVRPEEENLGPAPDLGPIGQFVAGMIERMHVDGPVGIEEAQEGSEIIVTLRGTAIADLTRSNGDLLGALTHLTRRALEKLGDDDASARLVVAAGDPEEERLEERAREQAAEVRKTGEAIVMDEMNARERWIVHNVLRGEEGVRSESVGDGRTKRVKIVPE